MKGFLISRIGVGAFRAGFSLLVLAATVRPFFLSGAPVEHVIHISVDGLRPDAITALGPTNLPNFYRFRTEGAFTENARTDYDYTVTLPNHTCQLTGRPVLGAQGHGWTGNSDPPPGVTLASNRGFYIAGAFDVAHDHGLRTAAYVSKTKFSLFDTSWNATNGAPDLVGEDNGRDKIDLYVYLASTAALVNTLVANFSTQTFHYVFIHLTDPDSVGHSSGWDPTPGSPYSNVIKTMDQRLGVLFDLVTTNAQLAGRTALLLTSDHGGYLTDHSNATLPQDYTIPFYVWGPGVMAGAPLYGLNPTNRLDPGTGRPTHAAAVQPIRNAEAANTCLKLLGLPAVPGSVFNAAQDLALTLPTPALSATITNETFLLTFSSVSNALYDVQVRRDLLAGDWTDLLTNLPGNGGVMAVTEPLLLQEAQRFYRVRAHF